MVAIAGTVGPNRRRRFNHFFSDTGLHLRFQSISRAPFQSIWCTCSVVGSVSSDLLMYVGGGGGGGIFILPLVARCIETVDV